MHRYIALLGGINVGGHRVKMDVLRALFTTLGFTNVATFIASGNVIFETAAADTPLLETQIEQQLQQALGYTVPTFIRSAHDLAAIARYQPWASSAADSTFHTLSIMFTKHVLPSDVQAQLAAFATPVDTFYVHKCEIYWLCQTKTTESLVDWPRLGKTIALPPMTVRNANTIRNMAAKHTQ
jgi:uncharacterized protein (DUF1697 family)